MSKKTNPPSHRVYAVTKVGKENYWRAIGAVWPHSDGKGFGVKLDFLPLSPDAEIVIREPLPETEHSRTGGTVMSAVPADDA